MNRIERARIAQQTVGMLARGDYLAPSGQTVSIRVALDQACASTRLYRPGEAEALFAQLEPDGCRCSGRFSLKFDILRLTTRAFERGRRGGRRTAAMSMAAI